MFDNFTRMALLNAPTGMLLSTFTTEPLQVEVTSDAAHRPTLATGHFMAAEALPITRKRPMRFRLRFGFGS